MILQILTFAVLLVFIVLAKKNNTISTGLTISLVGIYGLVMLASLLPNTSSRHTFTVSPYMSWF